MVPISGDRAVATHFRFMTPDPFVGSATDLQSYNRYSYVNNNPLMYTDPQGLFVPLVIPGICAAGVGIEGQIPI